MADSITVLSTGWNDSSAKNASTAANTTINAGMFEGIVRSNPNISGNYSGGVENFLRLLENWGSGNILTYNGSIVVMFPSQYATNSWQPTSSSSGSSATGYYNAPTRHWAFDLNFANQALLPPLTPQTKAVIRGQWSAY
jgi:archaellum component FlaG (FlaF/FlaG flagellin family)